MTIGGLKVMCGTHQLWNLKKRLEHLYFLHRVFFVGLLFLLPKTPHILRYKICTETKNKDKIKLKINKIKI